MKKKRGRGRWGMLLLGGILFAGVIALSGDESLDQIGRVRPVELAAAFGGTALMLLIFSQRWRSVANALAGRGCDLDTRRAFFFYSVTASATAIFMPQTANVVVVRTAMLNRFTGVPLGQAGASVVMDKLFDLLPVLLLTPPALLLALGVISLDILLVVIVIEVVIAAALMWRYHALYMKTVIAVLRRIAGMMARLPVLKRLNVAARLDRLEGSLQGAAVQRASLYTLVGTLAMLLRSWLIAQAVGLDMTPLHMLAGIALAQASLVVAITPGALGTLELGWYVGLSGAGVPGEQISVFLIAHRVLQSVFVLVLYVLGYVGQMSKKREWDIDEHR